MGCSLISLGFEGDEDVMARRRIILSYSVTVGGYRIFEITRRWMTRERRGASYSGASKAKCNEYVRSMWCKKKKKTPS